MICRSHETVSKLYTSCNASLPLSAKSSCEMHITSGPLEKHSTCGTQSW